MKYILVIGDGMADNPVAELGRKTPLQYANIPTIDALAAKGEVGSVQNIPEGMPAGSDTAILSIMGCDPRDSYGGRAPLEAAARGISLYPGDVAYRCNMVSLEDGPIWHSFRHLVSHNAGGVDGDTADELLNWLCDQIEFAGLLYKAEMTIFPGHSFRHIAVQRQPKNNNGLKLTPPHDHIGDRIDNLVPSNCGNAIFLKSILEKANELLDLHPINNKRRAEGKLPVNGLWFWAEGTATELPSFKEKYGIDGSVISAVPLFQGIATLSGLEKVIVDGATGELDTNYEGKADAVLQQLEKYDFTAVHVEAPDECTHNGDLKGKIQAIENLDSRVVKRIVEGLEKKGEDYRMLILSDHKTLISNRAHDGGRVPYLLYDSRRDSGKGMTYCEESGDKGTYIDAGTKLMGMLLEK